MAMLSRPARRVALASLILSVIFFGVTFFVGRWSGFFAVYAVSWFIGSAALVCFILALQFHTRALAERERLDMGRLASDRRDSAIFQAKGEAATLFAVAQRRLEIFEKWFLPVFSALVAAYQAGIGFYLFKAASDGLDTEPQQPLVCAICVMAVAFVSFLLSRYATGMSAQQQWRPLRAAGSLLLGVAFLCFILAVALALVQFKIFILLDIMDVGIGVVLVVLGIETALNVVLDIYRPRLKGRYSRSAFDSRLLGIINEPGRIFRTAAGAIDYQFGFKVSQTWFYKLLEKAVVPLILFAAAVLYLLSCFIVVAPDEQAVIERFGNPAAAGGDVRIIGPGLACKWPWPIDIAYEYPVEKVSQISIGFVPKLDPKTKELVREPLLWGKAHYEKEDYLLVASEQTTGVDAGGAVPVSLIVAAVPVQYRIKDLYSFIYNHKEPEKLLESICYRELTRFAASAKVEVDDRAESVGTGESLLGAGRARANSVLTERIQQAADRQGLGVEIVFLGLQGLHPPPEVAVDYQKVVGAVQKKQAIILSAYAQRNKTLSALAGSVGGADGLYNLAAKYQQARQENKTEQLGRLESDLDTAFTEAGGDIFKILRQAKSYAFERATVARAAGERFDSQLKAYRAAKEIYKHQQKLAVFEEAIENIRKFIVVAGKDDNQVFIVDVQEKLTPSLYDISVLEESKEK